MGAKVISHPTVEVSATLRLTEKEIAGLSKALEWGADTILSAMLVPVSTREIEPFRADLLDLFERLRSELPLVLHNAKTARAAFNGGSEAPHAR